MGACTLARPKTPVRRPASGGGKSTGATRSTHGRRLRLIGYVRVSKAREEMISPELQRTIITRAVSNEGHELVSLADPLTGESTGFIEDLDESGKDFARRKIAWIIEQVAAGRADGVAVWQVARWGRDLEKSLKHHRELVEVGGVLLSATEPLGAVETPMGEFQLVQLMAMAQLQSKQISAQWIQVAEHRRNLGLATSRRRFGYRFDEDAPAFVNLAESEAKRPVGVHVPVLKKARSRQLLEGDWLRRMYQELIDGRTAYSMVKTLDENGLLTSMGARFTITSLYSMLDTGFGAGFLARDVRNARPYEYLPGAHEPIIDLDTWQLYLRLRGLPGPPKERTPPRLKRPTSRLSGLVFCSTCQQMTTRNRHGNRFRFACRSLLGVTTKPCPFRCGQFESLTNEAVLHWLMMKHAESVSAAEAAFDAEHRGEKTELVRSAELIAELDAAEKKLTRRLSGYVTMQADGDITATEARPLVERARREREEVRTRRAELRSQAAGFTASLPTPDVFDALVTLMRDETIPAEDANRALKKVIRRVWLYPKGSEERVVVEPLWEPDRRTPAE